MTNVVQNAQGSSQTRKYNYDGLNRLSLESNPELQGITYLYDSLPPGSCGPGTIIENGALVQKTTADGSYNCYVYDSLNRLTDVGYSAPTGHCKRFRYDNTQGVLGSIPTGVTVSNTLGRLAETDICTGWPSQASIITDEWFSYDADGRLTDVYEMTPHSGGYYHTTASYWANGVVNTLSGVPGLSSWTFTLEGEGRPSSATYGTTNWVTGTTYYPSNTNTTLTFGNGDKDVYGYDATTGRMNQFTFTVGATPQSLVGKPNWNANGTLGSLAVTDPFNSVNTQTCSYAYDDLSRLAGKNSNGYSVDCGSGWQQLITLDAFGNIAKSGTSSFAASYINSSTGTTNNQEQSVGSCIPTYDANGNLTKDCSFSTPVNYAWDVYGKPTTLNGIGLTYDALDREVETASGSAHLQILYSPIGKIGLMSGQSASKIRVPLPEGSTAVLVGATGGTKQTLHSDWLGSSRLATTYSNRAVAYDTAYAPFGESYGVQGSSTYDLDFTGQFQGTLNGLDDFLYREYSPVQGRWISPDPSGLSAVDPSNPESWNRYSYASNNPLRYVDPLGLFCVWDNGSYDSNDDSQSGNPGLCENLLGGTWFNGSPSDWNLSADWSGQQSALVAGWAQGINPSVGDFGDPTGTADASVSGVFSPVYTTTSSLPGNLTGPCPAQPLAGDPLVTTQFGAIDPSHPQPHLGRDYAVPVGTPVFAPYPGNVGFAGSAGTFGNLVVITNPSWNVYLGHLSSIMVTPGNQVNAGDQVALSGNTGHSTGPHLHFEQHTAGPIWQNGHAPRATAVEPCY
jgi:RHS repeat-associated protein